MMSAAISAVEAATSFPSYTKQPFKGPRARRATVDCSPRAASEIAASPPAWIFAASDAIVAQHASEATQYRTFDRTLSGYKKRTKALFGKSCDLRQRQAM
jgi:hypothetical protein